MCAETCLLALPRVSFDSVATNRAFGNVAPDRVGRNGGNDALQDSLDDPHRSDPMRLAGERLADSHHGCAEVS
jgi:hypothetical protein